MLNYISLALSLFYAGTLFYLIIGAVRLYRKHSTSRKKPFISIIVPLRNEGKGAQATLDALAVQDYKGEWEVICVNDRSTDKTGAILKQMAKVDNHFKIIEIGQDEPHVTSPKKRALQRGFDNASGEIFITTDGDCVPQPGWLTSMAKNFTAPIGIVQGSKRIARADNLLTKFQEIETLAYVSVEAASFALGKPMLASAPSLAYRRTLYEEAGGFDGMEHLVSGDDDMLVHKMQQSGNYEVRYNVDPEACVRTQPANTWKEMLLQRARWASNGLHYESRWFVLFLICLFSYYVMVVAGPFLVITGLLRWELFVFSLAVKFILDHIFVFRITKKLFGRRALLNLWWAEFLHYPIIVFSVITGHLGLYKWK
ncbi:MAG: glycosyltransferase [Fibrobacteria bacterium]|nr:glycosyltransferase [Fibrobacteria bacterium]